MDHLAINSTTDLATEARVNAALPTTVVVLESMAKLLNLYPRTEFCSDLNESGAKVVPVFPKFPRGPNIPIFPKLYETRGHGKLHLSQLNR